MVRLFRALAFSVFIAAPPLGAAPAGADPVTGSYSAASGCSWPGVTAAAGKVFGTATSIDEVSGSGSGQTASGGSFTAGGTICRFHRINAMLFAEIVITDKAAKIFDESRHTMTMKTTPLTTLAESPGHLIGYRNSHFIDVRWILLPSGASNPALADSALEPIAMALLCYGHSSC